jgi:putative hydrolase of the HAD superfamily
LNDYKHIFFDLDRTIWDFETNSYETLTELAVKYKLDDRGIDSTDTFIQEYNVINNKMWDQLSKGLIDKQTLRFGRFYEALLKFNIDDKKLSEQIGNDYISISPYKTALFPNANEVLAYLNEKYVLHIITNGFDEVQHTKLKNSNIDHYFDHVITSERAGYSKPDVRIFEYSMNLANTDIASCVMIGDNLQADILGAKNAGINQVFFNHGNEVHAEEITHEINSLKELIEIL